ncbi:DNA-binding response regulator, OmpR family, contains REC and winged-helix (wHTH) domain [Pseudarcicella hirudinis]|uniref:DNA-binding response regulator, OmpR family, contains REC and winged-helix (WHTH) domain n=1 Tax=Pseudarcicella hirudinis TaxID=1079859 RepID=A0A1I5SX96_9BACT|nr:response regulator transcription factor [Pseudarcicella hirudinis]SFP75271.1 DNA-binding response regulator, OmpR family, contains REC and winged-helix (wHTH) domain [Pseudarcicella hirudinis]
MKLLFIEDEKSLRQALISYFEGEGYLCESAHDFASASEKINLYQYDCVVVDINLPDGSGLNIIKSLKQQQSESGIIIVSARNALDDKLHGLELGSDDYLTKPFHLSELNARIKSIFRRRTFKGQHEVSFQEIKIRTDEMKVSVKGEEIVLTKKEFELLIYLIANQNRMLTKAAIAEHLWGDNADMLDNFDFIYTHIKNLRKKLMEKGCPDYLHSVYGMGYKFGV